jgi:ABC-type glycerol-3-phosphate transport system substrate-binding protein
MSRKNLITKKMKKGMSVFAAMIIAAMVFTSCGGSSASKSVDNSKDSISTITENDSVSSDASVEEGAANKNEDFDAVLKSYETYIDKYIALMKKAKNGDASALADYPAMMKSATDLQTKLGSAGDKLSTAQMTKFVELQNKLVKAASEIQ